MGFYKEDDLVTVNAEEEELDLMNAQMNARRARVKAAKKAAKEAKKRTAGEGNISNGGFKLPSTAASTSTSTSTSSTAPEPPVKKPKPEDISAFKGNEKSKSKGTGSSVQNDPSKSEVYKKLFSSHKSAQNLPKGNWVTFDPRYN